MSWRHLQGPGGFDPTRYRFGPLDEATAKAFLRRHHYLGSSYPAALHRYGMTDRDDGLLVGVAVYSAPVQAGVLRLAFPQLRPYTESVELGRFAILDEIAANAESWLLARTFHDLLARGVRGVVSFADPMPRRTPAGLLVAGHTGVIYQACNGIYTGRGTARSLIMLPDGSVLNARAAQKVRRQEQGHRYVEERLTSLGAAARRPGQDPASWLRSTLEQVGASRIRHRGPHRYLFPLGQTRRDRDRVLTGVSAQTYPKTADPL